MKNTLNEFVNKLLDDIHNIDPELSLKRQTEYNQNFSNKLLNEQSSITAVSCRREQLKKFYKYLDTEAVAMNCNDKEIDEVINDFFNCN